MCSLLCNFNCYCTLGASLMLALSAIDVSLHYYYMQNFHRKKKKKKKLGYVCELMTSGGA